MSEITTEAWRPIEGYDGRYFVSNRGNIKSTYDGETKMLAISNHGNGYCHVSLTKNGKSKTFLVHRLVANYFLEPQEGKTCVNHKDYNRRNNNASNLEWCTYKENIMHSSVHMHGSKKRLTNTGEHHISRGSRQGDYRVSIGGKNNRIRKSFMNLNDAIAFRDKILGFENE